MQEANRGVGGAGWASAAITGLSEVPFPEVSYQRPQVKRAALGNRHVFQLVPCLFPSFLSFIVKRLELSRPVSIRTVCPARLLPDL